MGGSLYTERSRGLGVLNLDVQNRCLLSKWLFKLLNEDGVWQQLLRNKYLKNKTLTQVQHMSGDSQFWVGLVKVKEEFLSLGRFRLGDGSQVRFWEDAWITPRPLKSIFPTLYNIVRRKGASMRTVLSLTPLNVAFRRSLVGVNLQAWHEVGCYGGRCTINKPEGSFCVGATSEWIIFSKIHVQSLITIWSFTV
jgi:hypothetical protein